MLGGVPALEVIGFLACVALKCHLRVPQEQSTAEPTNLTGEKFPNLSFWGIEVRDSHFTCPHLRVCECDP